MSFIRNWVDQMSQYTAASKVYHRAAAYAAVGAMLTREKYKCILAVGTPRLWTNLYIVFVGSTKTYKSTPISMIEQLIDGVCTDGNELKCGDDMTPEGLLNHLDKHKNTDWGPATIMLQTEWVNLLMMMNRQYSALLHPLLIQLYDVQNDYRRTLAKHPVKIPCPRLTMLGAITPEKLAQYGESQDWEGGFFNRIIFLSAPPERVQEDQPRIPQSAYDSSIKDVQDRMEHWFMARSKINWDYFDFDKSAIKICRGLYLGEDDPELHGMLQRSQSHLTKIAAIEQWDEDPERPQIGVEAARRAREFIEYYQKGIPHIVTTSFARSRADFEGDRMARSVLRFIAANQNLPNGGPTKPDVLRQCGLDARRLYDALNSLIDAGHVQAVQVDAETVIYRICEIVQGQDVKPHVEQPQPVVLVGGGKQAEAEDAELATGAKPEVKKGAPARYTKH